MIKDCAWVPQHRRTRLLLPNTSKPIARFSVSGFALYPLSILIGVHNDAGLAPQPRGRPHHAPVNSSIPRVFRILLLVNSKDVPDIAPSRAERCFRRPHPRRPCRLCYDRTRPIAQGGTPDWLKPKNPACAAVKREEEEDWGR